MSAVTLSGASLTTVHAVFLTALPDIDDVLRFLFRKYPSRLRAEALADARAACWHAWHGLLKRGKDPLAVGPTGIARNAARYVKAGRQLGCGTSGHGSMDVYNRKAQQKRGLTLVSLDEELDSEPGAWREWTAEDNRVSPADEAAFRIDFEEWLAALPERKRAIAELLAGGHEGIIVARMVGVSTGRVCQVRHELVANWEEFQRQCEGGQRGDEII